MRSDSQPPMLPPGQVFAQYVIVRRIGMGATSEVYEARHQTLKKRVALKVMRHGLADRADLRGRFTREGEAAVRVNHPHVVNMLDIGVYQGIPYLVMEYLEGQSLDDLLSLQGRIDLEPLTNIILPVIAAVAAGHQQGVVHRDLKPGNIYLAKDASGRMLPKVLDFGVSRLTGISAADRLTLADSSVLGTPHYMSPEQAQGKPAEEPSDQYSLGVICYEAYTGRLPRDRPSLLELIQEVAHGSFEPPRVHRPEIPLEFEGVILRAMAPRPQDRFSSVRELGAAFLPFATEVVRQYWAPEFAGAQSVGGDVSLDLLDEGSQPVTGAPSLDSTGNVLRSISTPSFAVPFEAEHGSGATVVEAPLESSQKSLARKLLPVAIALALLVPVALALRKSAPPPDKVTPDVVGSDPHPSPPATFQVAVRADPSEALIELDGRAVGHGTYEESLPKNGTSHILRVSAAGYIPHTVYFKDLPPPKEIGLVPEPPKTAVSLPERIIEEEPLTRGRRVRARGRRAPPDSELHDEDPPSWVVALGARDAGVAPVERPTSSLPADEDRTETPQGAEAFDRNGRSPSGDQWPRETSRTDNKDPWLEK